MPGIFIIVGVAIIATLICQYHESKAGVRSLRSVFSEWGSDVKQEMSKIYAKKPIDTRSPKC